MPAKGPLLFALALILAASIYTFSKHYRLVWLAQAQTTFPGFTARMVSYSDYGTPEQKFIEEQSVTVTRDGAVAESHSLPGRPLSEVAVTVTSKDGHRLIGVGPIGLKTVAPPVPAEGIAKSNAYKARLHANGCVDAARGEILLFPEKLLERWDAVVVQRSDFVSGSHRARIQVWRVPALNCQQVQAQTETTKDGNPAGSTFTKLVALEFVNTHSKSFTGQLAEMKEVAPSNLYKRFTEHVGQPACTTCDRRLGKMDKTYEATTNP